MSSPAQIENAWLAAVEFRDCPESIGGGPIWFAVDSQFELKELQALEEDNGHRVEVEVTLKVLWFDDEAETAEASDRPFDLSIAVGGEFRFLPGRDERFIRAWLDYNGEYLLWPYARAYVATITGLGRFPKLTVETLQVPQLPELESEEDAAPATSATEQ